METEIHRKERKVNWSPESSRNFAQECCWLFQLTLQNNLQLRPRGWLYKFFSPLLGVCCSLETLMLPALVFVACFCCLVYPVVSTRPADIRYFLHLVSWNRFNMRLTFVACLHRVTSLVWVIPTYINSLIHNQMTSMSGWNILEVLSGRISHVRFVELAIKNWAVEFVVQIWFVLLQPLQIVTKLGLRILIKLDKFLEWQMRKVFFLESSHDWSCIFSKIASYKAETFLSIVV